MPTALVTGTSTGIGEAVAARLAALGWTVYGGVRRDTDADRLKASIDGDVRPVILDVTEREHIERAIATIAADVRGRGLQALVNNAGVGSGGPVELLTDESWRSVFDVNLFGVVALTRAAMPLLRAGDGRIVYVGSVGGRLAGPGLCPYSASKFAIEALAETQRQELARAGEHMKVSLVEPGAVKTAIWDKADSAVADVERSIDSDGRARYEWLLDQTRGFVADARRRGIDPAKVADAVEHALIAPRPKARYLVGSDAKLMGNVVARLPDRLRDRFTTIVGARWQRIGHRAARRSRH